VVGSQILIFFLAGKGAQPLPQTPPLLFNILAFFQKPTLNNPSMMCHCKCIIAQVQSAWMPACLQAWVNFQSKVMKWQWSVRAAREIMASSSMDVGQMPKWFTKANYYSVFATGGQHYGLCPSGCLILLLKLFSYNVCFAAYGKMNILLLLLITSNCSIKICT